MRTTQWDRIVTSAPLNTTAAVVRDGQGEEGVQLQRKGELWSDVPLGTRPCPPPLRDLAGLKVGRFTVVGYHGSSNGGGGKWTVRCACGGYTIRKGRALTKTWDSADREPMCSKCGYIEHCKVELEAAKRGHWPDGAPCNRTGLKTAAGSIRLKDPTPSKEPQGEAA